MFDKIITRTIEIAVDIFENVVSKSKKSFIYDQWSILSLLCSDCRWNKYCANLD